MLSKSLGAARTAVRDLFRSADHRRNREHCWDEAADEWGVNIARARVREVTLARARGHESLTTRDTKVSTEASDNAFFTSLSWQSNLTDITVPAPSMDNVIIKEGPRRHVPHIRSVPVVEEACLVLDRVPASLGNGTDLERAGHTRYSAQIDGSHKSHPAIATTAADGEGASCEGDGQQAGGASAAAAVSPAGHQRITASTLFAYRAMNTRAKGHGARLHHKAAQTNEDSCQETEARYKDAPCQKTVSRSSGRKKENYHASTRQETSAHGHDPMQDSLLCGPQDGTREAASADFTHKYDISDDEGNSPGRISPRTFRLWATGLSSQEVASEREHACFQACMGSLDDGIATSAAQPGLTDDDSTWSSDSESMVPSRLKWNHILEWRNRMANPMPDDPSTSPPRAPGQVVTLKNHDILSALSHPSAPPLLANVPLSHLHAALRLRHQLLLDSRQAETRMAELKAEFQAQIGHLPPIAREEASPANAESGTQDREQRCREEIYRHVEGYLGDLAGLYLASQERVRALAEEVDGLVTRERVLRRGVC